MSKDSKQAIGTLVAAVPQQDVGSNPGLPVLRRRGCLGFLHANAAARCEHVRMNGEQCGQPALRGKATCRFHGEAMSADMEMPVPEDAASVQLGLVHVMRALLQRRYDLRECTALLYMLQIAASNLRRLREEMAGTEDEQGESPLRELMEHLRDDAISKQPNRL